MSLRITLPWQIPLLAPALVEGDQKMGTVVAEGRVHSLGHHLILGYLHL